MKDGKHGESNPGQQGEKHKRDLWALLPPPLPPRGKYIFLPTYLVIKNKNASNKYWSRLTHSDSSLIL